MKVLSVLCIIATWLFCGIAAISFITYLVKDIPFMWWSLIAAGCSFIGIFVFFVLGIVRTNNEIKTNPQTGKSKYQERLEEMARNHRH